MELSPRKKAILYAVVKYHIATGEPIGSKILSEILPDSPSSATLRNEMNELDKLGFLTQPHTSAGRIPTSRAYRFYVDSLKDGENVDEKTKELIDGELSGVSGDSEKLVSVASRILSKITGLPSINAFVADKEVKISRIEIIPLSSCLYTVIAVTDDRKAKSRICKTPAAVDAETLERLKLKLSAAMKEVRLEEITPAFLQKTVIGISAISLETLPIVNCIAEMLSDMSRSTLNLSGELNLYSMLQKEREAKDILSVFERSESILPLFYPAKEDVGVIFGDDTGFFELKPSTVIYASYGGNANSGGRIGVIGPTRMSYEQIIPRVGYLAKKMSEIMEET